MGLDADYTALITDESLYILGDPVKTWATLDLTLKFNEPGAYIMNCPADSYVLAQIAAGNRIVLVRDPHIAGVSPYIVAGGPIEKYRIDRTQSGDANSGVGMLNVNFTDDLALVAARATYPDPAHTAAAQTASQWTYSGNAELAIRSMVDLNAGPSALAARRVPMLTLGAVAGVGSSVSITADRMEPLLDVARRAAIQGGGLGFRTRQSGQQILFEVYQPVDRSTSVLFSFDLHNLLAASHEVTAPSATTAIVGGQGTSVGDQTMVEVTNTTDETAWGRWESYVARAGSAGTTSLTNDGNLELGNKGASVLVATGVVDIPDQRYGVHYNLGDKVSAQVLPGISYSDVVSSVRITADAKTGEVVQPMIGLQTAIAQPQWVQQLQQLYARLGKLERSVMPAL